MKFSKITNQAWRFEKNSLLNKSYQRRIELKLQPALMAQNADTVTYLVTVPTVAQFIHAFIHRVCRDSESF